MEKKEKETLEFMNVDSFSQLPFIRPAAHAKEKGIRLFGIEFGTKQPDSEEVAEKSESGETTAFEEANKEETENGDSGRKFECHYCCRNFPTSQALGGHQNAHKRERQHAKRAHLQSAMAHHSLAEGPVYGLVNYRLRSAPPPPTLVNAFKPLHHPSWTYNGTGNRFYGSHGSFSQPINGSPLQGLWRIPTVQSDPTLNRDRSSLPLPLFSRDDSEPTRVGGSSSYQSRHVYENTSNNVQDHVSLDLHL
eukprot:TRINITY_DN5638_c0_g2_i1.p1 TRINITY_DN5638_c0_g2~~TRINITY_DN5638_c0_g2_i1.p1  ORF type:complete len:267 (+),score=-3.20 TRINITY_DN5638_c0_g2_i1:57-803(+)